MRLTRISLTSLFTHLVSSNSIDTLVVNLPFLRKMLTVYQIEPCWQPMSMIYMWTSVSLNWTHSHKSICKHRQPSFITRKILKKLLAISTLCEADSTHHSYHFQYLFNFHLLVYVYNQLSCNIIISNHNKVHLLKIRTQSVYIVSQSFIMTNS